MTRRRGVYRASPIRLANDPDLIDARRRLGELLLDQIKSEVAAAPPLADEQCSTIAALFRSA